MNNHPRFLYGVNENLMRGVFYTVLTDIIIRIYSEA